MESIYFRLIDSKGYWSLCDEIEAMSDPKEKQIRQEFLDSIMEIITDYDVHVREYEYRRHGKAILDRGVKVTPVSASSAKRRWGSLFAAGITPQQKRKVFYDQFRWHLFSYQVLNSLQGEAAKDAFRAAEKGKVFAFFQHCDDAWLIENAGLLRPEDFNADIPSPWTDCYLFDPEHRWTYIHTHELDCGPYFFTA